MSNSEDLKRTYQLDFFTKVEITPTGTVNVFGTMQQEQLTNYEARLSVMDMTVNITSNAAAAALPMGEVALMFLRHWCPKERPENVSATQRKWFETGASRKYFQTVKDETTLAAFEVKPSTDA